MSRAGTKLLAGANALSVGVATLPIVFVAILGVLSRTGFAGKGLPLVFVLVLSGCVAYEAFRRTFNGLSERWSNESDPPHIRGWRYRRTVVRSS